MKDMYIIFPLIPHESVWIYWLEHNRTQQACKVEHFSANIQLRRKKTFSQALKNIFGTLFFKMLSFNDRKIFHMNPTANGHKIAKFSTRESRFCKF